MAKNTLPEFVPPMMANSADKPFDSPDFIFEIKLDGYRAITVFDAAGKSHLWSRSGLHKNGSPLFRLSVPSVASYDSISDNIRHLFPVVGYFKVLLKLKSRDVRDRYLIQSFPAQFISPFVLVQSLNGCRYFTIDDKCGKTTTSTRGPYLHTTGGRIRKDVK